MNLKPNLKFKFKSRLLVLVYILAFLISLAFGIFNIGAPNLWAADTINSNSNITNITNTTTPIPTSSSSTPKLFNQTIAIVNDQIITQAELNQAVQETLAEAKMSGLTPPSPNEIKPQVLNELILQKIALQMASLNHITVSDDEVDQTIAGICDQNHTTVLQLKNLLAQNGMSLSQYRIILKNKLIIRKLEESAVANNIIISDQDVANYLNKQKNQSQADITYTLSHILIAVPDNPTPKDLQAAQDKANQIKTQVSQGLSFTTAAMKYSAADDALQGGIIKNKTLDQLPTLFEPLVPELKIGEVIGPIQSPNGFYLLKLISKSQNTDQAHFVTQYHVQLILIKTSPILSSDQARTQMLSIENALKNGEPFEKLAAQNSQDYSSSSQGGDLGWVTVDQMPMGVGSEVLNLKAHEISKPFNLGDRWYIVKLLGTRQQENTQAYLESQAREALFQQKAMKAVQTWQTKLRAESYIKIIKK